MPEVLTESVKSLCRFSCRHLSLRQQGGAGGFEGLAKMGRRNRLPHQDIANSGRARWGRRFRLPVAFHDTNIRSDRWHIAARITFSPVQLTDKSFLFIALP